MHDCYAISSKMRDTGSNAGGWENTYIRNTLMAEILNKFPDEVKSGRARGVQADRCGKRQHDDRDNSGQAVHPVGDGTLRQSEYRRAG